MQVYTDEKVWKYIPDYDGLYQASSHGDIKSLKFGKERILKSGVNSNGYDTVFLCKDGVGKTYSVHRLVMYTHSHVDTELTINHIDENKRNNHISNLEYCTRGENVRKYNNNNPEKMSERGKIGGGSEAARMASKERFGHKYLDTYTGIIYNSAREVSYMMYETGQAPKKSTWRSILNKGLPQDRFTRVYT